MQPCFYNSESQTTLADVCKSVRYGYTASATQEKIGPQFIRITDIVPDSINWDGVPFCEIKDEDRKKYDIFLGKYW